MMQLQQAAQQLSRAGLLPPYVPGRVSVGILALTSRCRFLQAAECRPAGRRRVRRGCNGYADHDWQGVDVGFFFLRALCIVSGGDGNSLMEMMRSGAGQVASAPPAERYGSTRHAHYMQRAKTSRLLGQVLTAAATAP